MLSQSGTDDAAVIKKRNGMIGVAGSALAMSTRKAIELRVIEHLRTNGALLPMYFIPGSGTN